MVLKISSRIIPHAHHVLLKLSTHDPRALLTPLHMPSRHPHSLLTYSSHAAHTILRRCSNTRHTLLGQFFSPCTAQEPLTRSSHVPHALLMGVLLTRSSPAHSRTHTPYTVHSSYTPAFFNTLPHTLLTHSSHTPRPHSAHPPPSSGRQHKELSRLSSPFTIYARKVLAALP
jgi:hypothetical protein